MKKTIFSTLLFLSTFCLALAQQDTYESSIKGRKILGIGTTIKSNRYLQGNNDIYKELTFDYGLGNYISAGIFIGHQVRNYSFVSIHQNSGLNIYEYSQTFIPMGLKTSIHITSFLHDPLGLDINPHKWDIYVMYFAGLNHNSVDDKFDRNAVSPENQIDYRFYHTDEDMNYVAGLMTGIRYYPLKNFGVFLEGGLGPMGNFNLGISTRY